MSYVAARDNDDDAADDEDVDIVDISNDGDDEGRGDDDMETTGAEIASESSRVVDTRGPMFSVLNTSKVGLGVFLFFSLFVCVSSFYLINLICLI